MTSDSFVIESAGSVYNSESADRLRRRGVTGSPASLVCWCALNGLSPADLGAQVDPTLIRARCEAIHDIEDQSILYGQVIDVRTGTALPGSRVHLLWYTETGPNDSTLNRTATETTDGVFIFCDVPQRIRIVAWAEALGLVSPRTAFFFEGGESAREDLSVHLQQITTTVTGVLTDNATGRPIAGATVAIPGAGASALSDSEGRFLIADLPVGGHRVVIHHVAYGEPHVDVAADPSVTTHLAIRLDPRPIALEPISVEITARARWLEDNGFYRRVENQLGQFVTPLEIERQPYRTFAEVLRSVPGVNLRQVCKPHCSVLIQMAGSTQTACIPTFFMDGRRINQLTDPDGTIDLDMLVFGADLAAVEVYRGISETPPQFYGRCGSVVIWTKRGTG